MKVAVTGGSGQLGSLVLRRLLADRSFTEVVSLDRREPLVIGRRLRHVTTDVRDADLARLFEGCDAVVHFAFLVTVRASRELFWGVNVEGSKRVFDAAIAAGVKRIVYASSVAAYGMVPGHPVPLVEDSPRVHQTDFPYSATKYEVEQYLDAIEPKHPEVAITRLRPTILIGDRMEHELGKSLKNRLMVGIGDAPMPVVWDEDVADAAMLALKAKPDAARGAFNLCADELLHPRELARALRLRYVEIPFKAAMAFAKISPQLEKRGIGNALDEGWVKSGEVTVRPSSAKAKRELGWAPRCVTAIEVIKKYLEEVPRRLDPRLALFFKMVQQRAASGALGEETQRATVRMILRLTGEGGGELGILLEDGKLTIKSELPRPPSSIVTLPAPTLLELLAGKTDVTTVQFVTGKLRIEGEPIAAMVISGMVEAFRASTNASGASGVVSRAMSRWFGRARAFPAFSRG